MTNNKKSTVIIFFIVGLIIVAGIGYWIKSSHDNYIKKEKDKEKIKIETIKQKKAILNMASKYNAIIDWKKNINSKSLSFQIQNALLKQKITYILILYGS